MQTNPSNLHKTPPYIDRIQKGPWMMPLKSPPSYIYYIPPQVDVDYLDNSDEYQLVLPSGVKVGHRSLMRYYKQSSTRTTTVALSRNTKKLHKTLATYRALGWTQADQEQAARKARDIQYMKRIHSKYMAKLGVKNNKLQTHFRQQVNF
ncbi:hypothetical protein WA026_012305 [Henosepilachna vigintioctopunctata]|uniref:Uncharacterized protein n=1 Tax=Henosepilachna vigintioctopunctata TaxID=420089 RepID=A0AAW1UWQ5_9CUCU